MYALVNEKSSFFMFRSFVDVASDTHRCEKKFAANGSDASPFRVHGVVQCRTAVVHSFGKCKGVEVEKVAF